MRQHISLIVFIITFATTLRANNLPAIPLTGQAQCYAFNYQDISACLDRPEANNGTGVQIILRSHIELDLQQTVRIHNKKNIIIEGDHSVPSPVISETTARMSATGQSKQSNQNASFVEVTGNSSDIVLRHLTLHDFAARPNELARRCRIGADPNNPTRWETDPCHAPIFIGGARGNSGDDFPKKVQIDDLSIDSDKSILVEIRRIDDLRVTNSHFHHGTVYGLYFHPHFPHFNIHLERNEFQDTGTNALNLSNVDGVAIKDNVFINNHKDPQFMVCSNASTSSKTEACSGGQLLLADNRNAPVQNVTITGNTITMTSENLWKKSATGIEIKSGLLGKINGILIEGNTIHNISRQAIQVHKGTHSDIAIKNNQACGNLVDFGEANAIQPGVISINGENGVDLDSNRVGSDCDRNPVWASFEGTPKECLFSSNQTHCALNIKWKIYNLPLGKRPKVLVDGRPFATEGETDHGSKGADWIGEQDYKFELFMDRSEKYPIAVLNVHGKRN